MDHEKTLEENAERQVKYQIFVSSTFSDLGEQRKIVKKAILKTGNFPITLEDFGAKVESDREVIRKAVLDSDIFIIIIGHRYGDTFEKQNEAGSDSVSISYTQSEYLLALEAGKPILAFIRDIEEVRSERQKLSLEDKEVRNTDKYLNFVEKIIKPTFRSYWKQSETINFAINVTASISEEIKKLEKGNTTSGWVKAAVYPDGEIVNKLLENDLILDTIKRLNSFEKLDRRYHEGKEEKKNCAIAFRDRLLPQIVNSRMDLFFESGSSIAYVAREIGESLSKEYSKSDEGWHITTNNILVYLQLWMNNRLPCSMFPWSEAEEPYGASYGPISKIGVGRVIPCDYSSKQLDSTSDGKAAEVAIERLLKEPFGPIHNQKNKPILMIGAISGIQLSDDPKLEAESTIPSEIIDQVKTCRGFHVGSFHNKIFKRYMYRLGHPLVVMVHYDKVDCNIRVGRCHFVFDNRNQWDVFVREHPLAFIVGCRPDQLKDAKEAFQKAGFAIEMCPACVSSPAFFASNDLFNSRLGTVFIPPVQINKPIY